MPVVINFPFCAGAVCVSDTASLHQNTMVYSFTEQAGTQGGMICYQTAAKGEPALKALMDTHTGAWAPNTGNLVDKGCRERDPAYASAFPARAVLRAKGLPWKASPGQPTWDMSQWYKGPALQ